MVERCVNTSAEKKMRLQKVSIETIHVFLAQKRIAMVGISREPASLSVNLFKELCRRGYDVIPVNPNTAEALGRRCFARVQEIQPPVDAALLMTSPTITEAVVRDCADAGIRRVWMYRAGGEGAEAVAWPFGSASSFGSPGAGGSLGFADPTAGIGYAYVTSQMGTRLTGDPRDVALRDALYSAIPASSGA
jgi:predicted CoA-binding protein